MSEPPIELPTGQDGPPDLRAALWVAITLLRDVRTHLYEFEDDQSTDLALRAQAVRRVLLRLRAES